MSRARLRFVQFYIEFSQINQADWRVLQSEFELINRGWGILCQSNILDEVSDRERDELILEWVRAIQGFLGRRGLWKDAYIPWLERGLQAAQILADIENEISLL